MPKKSSIRLKVASPCHADWEQMTGDDAVRFCHSCEKNVYQLSNMTTDQVNELFAKAEEMPCIRFYQRKDGTVMTQDCPVGARIVRRKRAIVGLGAGVVSALYMLVPGSPPPPAESKAAAEPDTVEEVEPQVEDDVPLPEPEPIMMGLMVPEPEPERMVKGKPAFHTVSDADDDDE